VVGEGRVRVNVFGRLDGKSEERRRARDPTTWAAASNLRPIRRIDGRRRVSPAPARTHRTNVSTSPRPRRACVHAMTAAARPRLTNFEVSKLRGTRSLSGASWRASRSQSFSRRHTGRRKTRAARPTFTTSSAPAGDAAHQGCAEAVGLDASVAGDRSPSRIASQSGRSTSPRRRPLDCQRMKTQGTDALRTTIRKESVSPCADARRIASSSSEVRCRQRALRLQPAQAAATARHRRRSDRGRP